MANREPLTPEENRRANILSGISLVCMVGPILWNMLSSFFTSMLVNQIRTETPSGFGIIGSIMSLISGAAFIAAIVLIIYVRVKYPANIFGKVLMWVYIVFAILAIVVFAIIAIACAVVCNSAFPGLTSCCQECGRIG